MASVASRLANGPAKGASRGGLVKPGSVSFRGIKAASMWLRDREVLIRVCLMQSPPDGTFQARDTDNQDHIIQPFSKGKPLLSFSYEMILVRLSTGIINPGSTFMLESEKPRLMFT
jgi:hypothetical protein